MRYFPFFFDLRGRRLLIVGGGEVALRKAELLSAAGAQLTAVAPTILPELATLIAKNGGTLQHRAYTAADIDGCIAVISATDDDSLNRRVCADARARQTPINVVDNPALCDFIFPAIIDRAPLLVAVSSGGDSPVLARRIRARIEMLLPSALGRLCDFCAQFRDSVKTALPMARRRLFWEHILDGATAEAVLSGDTAGGAALLETELQRFAADNEDSANGGEVYLLGAGPGDADLLTFRAHRLLQQADVVLYDRLVSPAVLALARRDATKIFVGKTRDCHLATQQEINELLIAHAKQGRRVARLKGGDPFIFGRGGEEMLALRAAKIRYHTVPGITAATGCAAAAGIPLTHRGAARGVRFCTAYRQDLHDVAYWRRLVADQDCTLVFYMAGAALSTVTQNLINAGMCANTPAALICAGTTAAQQVVGGVLENIAARAESSLLSPALIIVGEVAALHLSPTMAAMTESPFPAITTQHSHAVA